MGKIVGQTGFSKLREANSVGEGKSLISIKKIHDYTLFYKHFSLVYCIEIEIPI